MKAGRGLSNATEKLFTYILPTTSKSVDSIEVHKSSKQCKQQSPSAMSYIKVNVYCCFVATWKVLRALL